MFTIMRNAAYFIFTQNTAPFIVITSAKSSYNIILKTIIMLFVTVILKFLSRILYIYPGSPLHFYSRADEDPGKCSSILHMRLYISLYS